MSKLHRTPRALLIAPVTCRMVSDTACSCPRVWPIPGSACWIAGIIVAEWRIKYFRVTILGAHEGHDIVVPVHRPWWKRVLMGLLRKKDVQLLPYPVWMETPIKVKVDGLDKAIDMSLIVIPDNAMGGKTNG